MRTRRNPRRALKMTDLKLIAYDFAKYGGAGGAQAHSGKVGQGGVCDCHAEAVTSRS